MHHVVVVLLLVGFGALVLGQQECSLATRTSENADRVSCAALPGRDPNANAHVVLTDFELDPRIVHESFSEESPRWAQIWRVFSGRGTAL